MSLNRRSFPAAGAGAVTLAVLTVPLGLDTDLEGQYAARSGVA